MLTRMNAMALHMPASGIRQVADLARNTPGCVSLTLGEPAFDTPEAIREATKAALDAGHTHYPPNAGLPALREAIAAHESAKQDAPVAAEQVLVTTGSTEALACAMLMAVSPGDEVIVPVPAFGLYEQQLCLARGRYVPMDTTADGFQVTAERLAAHITPRTKAIVLNSPNNPTGVQYTEASIRAATEACLRHDLFLFFDAVYDHISYLDSVPRPSMAALGERLVVVNAFSKTYAMTGWRIGYCVAQPQVLTVLLKVHAALTVGVSTFAQVGCADIFSVPTGGMLAEYRKNRDFAYARLCEMGLRPARPDGAFYLFAPLPDGEIDDMAFARRLIAEAGVAVVPGSCFGAPGHFRLSYCCDMRALSLGLERIATFLAKRTETPAIPIDRA